MTRDPRATSERNIHNAIADLLRFNAADGVVWYHNANERRTSPREGAFLKRMGVLAGVSDFTILVPREDYPLIGFLEVKAPKGRLSQSQIDFAKAVTDIGCRWAVAHSVDEALTHLHDWWALTRTGKAT